MCWYPNYLVPQMWFHLSVFLIGWLVCSVGGPESPGHGWLFQGAGGIPVLSEGLQPEQG